MATATSRITIPPQPRLNPALRTQINSALLSHNAIPALHASLLHECQASGWLEQIRARVLELLRNGECVTFGEVMQVVMEETKGGNAGGAFMTKEKAEINGINGKKEVNGKARGRESRGGLMDLSVPAKVVEEGVKIVRGVLEQVVDIGEDEEERQRRM